MASSDITEKGLASAVARFPEAASVLWKLARSDPGFREVCEEYALAQQSLAGFEARPDAAERPEIDDYRTLIVELEGEIDRFVREAGSRG